MYGEWNLKLKAFENKLDKKGDDDDGEGEGEGDGDGADSIGKRGYR